MGSEFKAVDKPFYVFCKTISTDDNIEFLINKLLDVKTLVPYLSEYANSLTNNREIKHRLRRTSLANLVLKLLMH